VADRTQASRNQLTGRHDQIKARIKIAQIAVRRRADETAEAAGQHPRHVRMRKRDGRRADTVCGAQRSPRQMIWIADLDQIRFKRAQGVAPSPWIERNAIATRDAWRRQLEHAMRRRAARGARDEKTVPYAGLGCKKVMLGEQIALYATAVRGEKQSDVGNMHLAAKLAVCALHRCDTRLLVAAFTDS